VEGYVKSAGGNPLGDEPATSASVSRVCVSSPEPAGDEPASGEATLGFTPRAAPEDGHHLLLQLGEGGTAQVFLAVHSGAEGVDKLVVLKVIKPGFADNDDLRRMFVNEARFAARLNHANIVQTSAVVQRAGMPAIVMEYLEGQSLAVLLNHDRRAIPLELHLRILVDALRGLHYAHELTDLAGEPLHVVHRDVSPQNIFVGYDGQVKLIDFGIAKLVGGGNETATGVIKGKVRYMPPEQIRGEVLDRRVDLYAAGVLLWEAAAREKMWKGQSEVVIMHRVLGGMIPDPRETNPDVPAELERILRKALAFQREDRYATAAELESDLEALLGGYAPVTSRDVSNFISQQFAGVRAERKRAVNLELQRRAALGPARLGVAATAVPLAHDFSSSGDHGSGSASPVSPVSPPSPASAGVSSAPPRPTSRRWGSLAVGALLVVMGLAWRRDDLRRLWEAAAAPPAPADATAALGPRPTPPALTALAAPPPALEPAPTPSTATATATAAPARIPVSTSGLRRFRLPVTSGAPATPAAPGPTAGTARKDCDLPYTIDAEGTKHFKTECF
jgi:serine/threonine protein kinase